MCLWLLRRALPLFNVPGSSVLSSSPHSPTMSMPSSHMLTTIPLSPLKSTFSIYSLPLKREESPAESTSPPGKARPSRLECVAYLVGLAACTCVCAIGIGSIFVVLGGLILGRLVPGYRYPSNTQLNVVPILVGGPILGLPTGIVAARVVLSMTRTVIALAIMLSCTLASAFAFPVGVIVLQRGHVIPSEPTPVQALAASGAGCAACLAVLVLLWATYRLVFVASKLSYCFYWLRWGTGGRGLFFSDLQ